MGGNYKMLSGGLPHIDEYLNLVESDIFHQIEHFSNSFIERNNLNLSDYAKIWVADPLHQWSRQWEYPYVYEQVAKYNTGKGKHVLDAGSGITFFPYFLQSQLPYISVDCCDNNKDLEKMFFAINSNEEKTIRFYLESLQETKFKPNTFDCIYCVSVLEHTNNYQKIINELYRILCPGGLFVLTFDINITKDNLLVSATPYELLVMLGDKFKIDVTRDLKQLLNLPSDIITTKYFCNEKLPWKETNTKFYTVYTKTFIKEIK